MAQHTIYYWTSRYLGWTSLIVIPLCLIAMLGINMKPDYAIGSAYPIVVLLFFSSLLTGYSGMRLLDRVHRTLQHMS